MLIVVCARDSIDVLCLWWFVLIKTATSLIFRDIRFIVVLSLCFVTLLMIFAFLRGNLEMLVKSLMRTPASYDASELRKVL